MAPGDGGEIDLLLPTLVLILGLLATFGLAFVVGRAHRVELKPLTMVIFLVGTSLLWILSIVAVWPATLNEDVMLIVIGMGFVLLGIAAGAQGGWRLVTPAGAALGFLVLGFMARGPLHPVRADPTYSLPPPIPLMTWAVFLLGSLVLLVPRRWASPLGAAVPWLVLVGTGFDSEMFARVGPMARPAFVAVAVVGRTRNP